MDYLLDDLVEYTMEKMAFAPPPYDPSKQKSVLSNFIKPTPPPGKKEGPLMQGLREVANQKPVVKY